LIPDGSAVKLKKSENYGVGDVVCIWFKPEAIPPGANPAWLKRVSRNAPHWVKQYPYADHPGSEVAAMMIVEQLNPRIRYTITCSDILAIHKAVGYSSTDAKIGGTVSAKGMLSIGGRA
jgi:hypothetical protein